MVVNDMSLELLCQKMLNYLYSILIEFRTLM